MTTSTTPPTARQVDVLDVSDLRFPGGTSHSVAEEVAAQSAAGWSTGLLHLHGPLVSRVLPVNPLIAAHVRRGTARLLFGREPVRARVTVVRHPAVLQAAHDQLPPVQTQHLVIVANAAPQDIDGYEHYRPELVTQLAREHFGVEPHWAPIGPLVRTAIRQRVPAELLLPTDWVNIIDVDAWQVVREGWNGDVPVIGRHSRNSPQKWPQDRRVLEAVYPTDGLMQVRVLGGAQPAEELLGGLPDSWQVHPFGAMTPREFLAGLDFFVYYHDPRWIEAFGRTILEAMASGLPAVLPPHFEPLFGDAARYAEPAAAARVIQELRADRSEWERQSARGIRRARERFGHEAHVHRLGELIGPPDSTSALETGSPADTRTERPRLLLISSNGAGMGHLTRLLAYARHSEAELEPHVLSLSQAVGVVDHFGYPYEYLPSTGATGVAPRRWHPYFVDRVGATLERLDPAVVVFDGTWPYDGIPELRRQHPRPRWVWSRRGLWKAGRNTEQLAKAAWFDSVLEPGDLAAELDRGVTRQVPAHRVGPVTLLDPDELSTRAEARHALGLPAEGPLALISLGAGNINDTSGDVGACIAALRYLGVGACLTRAQIGRSDEEPEGVHTIQHFPLSEHFRAFDAAVSATGYNSFHELLRFGVPSLFVANTQTALDDTEARARWAGEQGWAHRLPQVTVDEAVPLLADLLDRGPEMVAGAQAADPGNGALEAARHLIDVTERRISA